MGKTNLQLTTWWQKAVCILGIPLLLNTITATYFLNRTSVTIALLLTAFFIYDIIKRKKGKTVWELDDAWERIAYKAAWASLIISIVIITMSLMGNAFSY